MKRHFISVTFVLLLLLLTPVQVCGQRFRVATWNLENAFDTIHDEGKDDMEFTPASVRHWNGGRYWRKLKGISQTLAAMGLPELIGLQEVENAGVLHDLTRRTPLRRAGYEYVITDSPDSRGVDVALLYKPKDFSLITWRSLRVDSEKYGLRPTRDILHVTGVTGSDTLHVMVVHLPSRRNNNSATRQLRALAVETLCHALDSLTGKNVIVMGDCNAEPGDGVFRSLDPYLRTLLPTDRKTLSSRRGTYCFRGVWGFLDHILVSPNLFPYAEGEAEECRFPWLLRTRKQIPHRTYGGTSYLGGLSDHLPLTAMFSLERR